MIVKKSILFKLAVSILIAGVVSGSLVYFTINTLEDDLILKNQVATGNISKQFADSVTFYLNARKEDIIILGTSLKKRLFSESGSHIKNKSFFSKYGLNDFEMEFVKERFSCFYIINQDNKVFFAIERGQKKEYENFDDISLIKDISINSHSGKFFLKEHKKNTIVNVFSISEKISFSKEESFYLLGIVFPENYAEVMLKNRTKSFESIFIVSLKGEILIHSNPDMIGSNIMSDAWIKNRIIEQGGSEVFLKNKKRFLISGTRIGEMNSILCIIKPFSEFIGDIDRIRKSVYLAGTAFFMVSFAVMIFIVQIITIGQREKLIADAERKRAHQEKIYSTSLEDKNWELSNINETLEELHNAIKDEKEKIERIVNSIEDVIIMINEDLKIDYINLSADKIIFSDVSVKGHFLAEIESISWMIKPVMEIISGNSNYIIKGEKELDSSDNRKKVFQCSYIPIRSGIKKRTTACMAVFRDVTATIELDRMKTEFISTVSHELRTPMSAIRGTVELMLAGTLGVINGEQENFLKVMLSETNRLIRLINNILDLQKAESRMITLNIKKIDLNQHINDCIDIVRTAALEKNLEITCSIDADLEINTDSDKLRQIVLNLLNNAVKYTDNGGISLLVKSQEYTIENGDITLDIIPEINSYKTIISIEISDTGQGIEGESLERIFDRFYQADLNLTRKSGGTGLGLPITKELINILNGKIHVKSTLGKGSTFTVLIPSLPMDSENLINTRRIAELERMHSGYKINNSVSGDERKKLDFDNEAGTTCHQQVDRGSILLIDDDESLCGVIKKAFEELDYNVLIANSISDGLKILTNSLPFFIILDLGFPEGNGADYIGNIREMCPSSFILILTGDNKVRSVADSIKAGANDYMLKPFEVVELRKCLKKAETIYEEKFKKVYPMMARKKDSVQNFFDSSIIFGESLRVDEMKEKLKKIAASDETVLITGESGSGKELAARVIHLNSSRAGSPFIAINCGALSEKLLESELFGYVKGAFTGADCDKKGLFMAASGGTLFLDEIGDAPDKVQIRLLRVLQEKKVLPVGGVKAVDVDVRLLAATNKFLEKMVENKLFRKDLYFRLDVLRIKVPSLRERKDDIPILVERIIKKNFEKYGIINVTPEYLKAISCYDWPGNIRELENVVKKSFLNSDNKILTQHDLPEVFNKIGLMKMGNQSLEGTYKDEKARMIELFDKIYFEDKLIKTNGNIRKAAKLSNMHTKNFYTKIKKVGIDSRIYKNS